MQKSLVIGGCKLAYEVTGAGPPVIFIQGIGAYGSAWRPQVEQLSNEFQCLTFDNRGIGDSQPRGVDRLSMERLVEDVLALMDAEAWPRAHIVGHSLGGMVAQEVALVNPQRVLSLALLNTFSVGRQVGPMTPRMFWWGLRSVLGTRAMRRYAFLRLVWPPDLLRQCDVNELGSKMAQLIGHDLGIRPEIVPHQFLVMRRGNTLPRLATLSGIRTLVLSSTHDMLATPALGQQLASAIPGAIYHELDGTSHAAPIQCPERVNRLLLDHLRVA